MTTLLCAALPVFLAAARVDPTPHAVPKAPGGVFLEGERPAFALANVSNGVAVGYRVLDWRDKELLKGLWPTNRELALAAVPRGYYRVEIDGDAVRGTTFAVVGDPAKMVRPRDSFYGTDAAFSWCAGAFTCPWKNGNCREVVADLMRLAGLKHVRERLQWMAVQWTACGPANFGGYASAMSTLAKRGFSVVDYYSDAAPHLRTIHSERGSLPRNLMAVYDFSKKSAQAFWPTTDAWEFMNEQEGGVPEPVWDYVAAMKAAALGHRAGVPDVTVLNGSLFGIDRVRYTEELFRGEAWKYLNAFSFHYYEVPSACEKAFEGLRRYMARHGLAGAPVYVTECGCNLEGRSLIPAPPPWERCKMHSRDQELTLMEFYPKSQILMQMSGASRNYFFNFCAFNEGGEAQSKDWGVMRRDGTVKPIFAAMAAMTRALETSRIVGEMRPPAPGVRAFLFERPDRVQTVAYFSTSYVDTRAKAEEVYGKDRLVPFALPAVRGRRYELTDPVGCVTPVVAEAPTLALTASRHAAYASGFSGLVPARPATPCGKRLAYRPKADEDLTVVFRIDLDTNDFSVVATKSLASMRADAGRVKVTAWNFDGAAKTGTVRCAGAKVTGAPASLALPPFGSASFDATLASGPDTPLETRLLVDGVFAGRRTTPLDMPLFFERKFLGACERIEMKGSHDPGLWKAYGSQREFACVWDEAERAIRMDLAWDYKTADRWFFPRMSLAPGESLDDAKFIEFEVKSRQDKVENNYGCQFAQFDSKAKGGGGWVTYAPPLLTWEARRISLGGVRQPEQTSKIGFGGLPGGFRVTYWIRNIRIVRNNKKGNGK